MTEFKDLILQAHKRMHSFLQDNKDLVDQAAEAFLDPKELECSPFYTGEDEFFYQNCTPVLCKDCPSIIGFKTEPLNIKEIISDVLCINCIKGHAAVNDYFRLPTFPDSATFMEFFTVIDRETKIQYWNIIDNVLVKLRLLERDL